VVLAHRTRHLLLGCALVAAVLALAVPSSAVAQSEAYLLTASSSSPVGSLVPFDINNPAGANFNAATPIVGTGGERVLGIDFRPTSGVLYGLSEASRLYTINPATGAATQVGAPGAVQLDPFVGVFQGIGFDFNPVTEQLRVTEDDGLVNGQDDNFTVNPDTGIFTQQGDLGGAATDVDIAGVAHSNNVAGATATTVYAIETNQPVMGNSRLVVIDPPAAGTLTTIDSNGNGLGVVVDSQNIGFDITTDPKRGFAILSVGGVFGLYRIEVAPADEGNGTGDAALVGTLSAPAGSAVRGFARVIPLPAGPPPPPPPPPPPGPTTSDTRPPNTRIRGGPRRVTRSRSATFRFVSTEAGSRFQCKLDRKPFRRCRSPKRYRRLRPGRHIFRVRAVDRAGNVDRTPAVRRWRIRR
jgi:hypothetical protein